MKPEDITALNLLEAQALAEANGADKPAFRAMLEAIQDSPDTQERLVFELSAYARRTLERGLDARIACAWIFFWGRSVKPARRTEYLDCVETIVFQIFDSNASTDRDLGLGLLGRALHWADRDRFDSVFASLKRRCLESGNDHRFRMIASVEERILHPKPINFSKADREKMDSDFIERWSGSSGWN